MAQSTPMSAESAGPAGLPPPATVLMMFCAGATKGRSTKSIIVSATKIHRMVIPPQNINLVVHVSYLRFEKRACTLRHESESHPLGRESAPIHVRYTQGAQGKLGGSSPRFAAKYGALGRGCQEERVCTQIGSLGRNFIAWPQQRGR